MQILRDSAAGTLESGDAMVRVSPSDDLEVNVSSSVEVQYGTQVRAVIADTLRQLGVVSGWITVVDKGALDCTLRARVQAAVSRSCDQPLDWKLVVEASR